MSARVLLVEDEPGIVQVLADLLEAEGHVVETAGDGETGLQLACGGSFDLLILDVMLPGLSGIDVCHGAREQGFDGAILMLTALGRVPDRGAGAALRRGRLPHQALRSRRIVSPGRRPAAADPPSRPHPGHAGRVRRHHRGLLIGPVYEKRRPGESRGEGSRVASSPHQPSRPGGIPCGNWPDLGGPAAVHHAPRTVASTSPGCARKSKAWPTRPRHILTVRGEGYRFVK